MSTVEIRHFHLFCGLGGGAGGFNDAEARLGLTDASMRCLGGIDSNPAAIQDFNKATGTAGTVMDLFDREQYVAWHGHEPPADWSEATPADIRRAAGNERPHIVFTSSPCKGLSTLLSSKRSVQSNYQALNRLTVRGVWLTLEAWKDDPPEFILFENVPRIATRGRPLLDIIQTLLGEYGYATAETTHDCGELGGLGQSRKRFLLVARHQEKVPPFLYEPEKQRLKSIGEVIGDLPLPGDVEAGGPMHRLPNLQFQTWMRLALIEAGKDWRSLQDLRVEDGMLADFAISSSADYHSGVYGVADWSDTSVVVAGRSGPSNGRYSIADPRCPEHWGSYRQFGVKNWADTSSVVTGQRSPGQGPFSIADPRYRAFGQHSGKMRVEAWASPSHCVTGSDRVGSGALSVADPRPPAEVACRNQLPEANERGVFFILALDGTYHRPFTTLELAALQGLVQPGEYLALSGSSDGEWRERIGNAVPRPTARAIGAVMAKTLLLAWAGETFQLSNQPIWVRPIAQAISVDTRV